MDRALTAHPADAEACGEVSPEQEGVTMQVPITVQLPAGGALGAW